MNINYTPEPRQYQKLQGNEYLNKEVEAGAQQQLPIKQFIPDD